MTAKLFIGPMSKNIVNVVSEVCNEKNISIGLIPSRRQVEYSGGYVEGWTTAEFVKYARSRSPLTVLQRDHGGPGQGLSTLDDGRNSLIVDSALSFDLLHIDPWKVHRQLDKGISCTRELIKLCDSINPNCRYEIGTEQAIREYSVEDLEKIIQKTRDGLGEELFAKVEYAVVQGGTAIQGTRNVGTFNASKCAAMATLCRQYGLKSKEHNGDYLTPAGIKKRFELGLSALNIAPEFGVIETQCILEEILNHFDSEALDKFYNLCYSSNKWVKWLPKNIDSATIELKKHVIIRTSGHYVFSTDEFKSLKGKYPNIDEKIRRRLRQRIEEILCATEP
mgnify:CR=1 FL=1